MHTTRCLRIDHSLREAFTVIQLRCEELLRADGLGRSDRRTVAFALGECRRLAHALLEVVEQRPEFPAGGEPAEPESEG